MIPSSTLSVQKKLIRVSCMHEVSLMEQTLAIAIAQAEDHGASQIHRLTLRVGQQSGVVADALRFAFEVVQQNTIAAEARLEIEEIPVTCYCQHCHQNFQPEDWIYRCPQCDQISHTVLDGKQLELASLELS